MTNARLALLNLVEDSDWTEFDPAELLALRLQAARDTFKTQRALIPVLDRRAKDTGVDEIRSFKDLVPLLFAHTVYKSYPNHFVEKGRWDRMLDWLNTLSTNDPRGIDVSGVENADDWIARLGAHGHMLLATSGTSGKCSFLSYTREDRRTKLHQFRHTLNWPDAVPNNDRQVFIFGPKEGPNSAVDGSLIIGEMWGKPGGFYAMFEEPLRIADVSAASAFRKRMAEGKALPAEILAFQKGAAEQSARASEAMAPFIEKLLAHRHEPLMIQGLWAQMMQVVQRAREMGVADGDWHPDTRVLSGGGIKGVSLPDDYKEQIARFFGNVKFISGYGMTEMYQVMPRCEALRYHVPPALIPLPLDQPGEKLLNASSGIIEGRFAFLDLLFEGRWGGTISGDKVQMDFSERCACGRRGPTILDTISRFSQVGGDDHIGCAGTIEAYVKGEIAA